MRNRKILDEPEVAETQEAPSAWWDVAAWGLALAAFAGAMVSSYREIHYNIPNDLRSPAILLVEALVAAGVAFGFAAYYGSLTRWADAHRCLRFGLWAAAVFRFVPPMFNEDVLFLRNCGTFDLPYGVLGACIHGGLATVLAYPFGIRVLALRAWDEGGVLWEMCGVVVLLFYLLAVAVRLASEHWALG